MSDNQDSSGIIPDDVVVENKRHTGVGVLIVTNVNGVPNLLLGRESFKSIKHQGAYMVPIYEEFGGGIQRKKSELEENACYELREETCNLIDFTDTPGVLSVDPGYTFDLPFKSDRIYRLYVVNIDDVQSIIPYFVVNRQLLSRKLCNPEIKNKNKMKTFLEMDTVKLVPLSVIYKAMQDINNYICFKAEDTIWNINNKNAPYRGILRVDQETFINERLIQYLGGVYRDNDDNLRGKGIDICDMLCKKNENSIKLSKPVKVKECMYSFLQDTFTFTLGAN